MSIGWASYFKPLGTGGWVDFWWMDDVTGYGNGDGIVDANELYWHYPGVYAPVQVFDSGGNVIADVPGNEEFFWGGYDYYNPQQTAAPRYTIDDSVGSRLIWEGIFTLEREVLPDFGVAVDFTYRRLTNFNWNLRWDGSDTSTIESQDWYSTSVGTIPSTIGGNPTGDGGGKPYYLRKAGIPNYYPRYRDERPDYYEDFMGAELRMTKRLSNKWMFNGSVTYQTEKRHYGNQGILNPTNKWALDNRIYAPSMGGGSGKINMRVFSHWLVKLSGLYQLPMDFNVSFAFNARQGHVLVHTVEIYDYNAPNPYNRAITAYLDPFGSSRLPTFWNLNLRLEKVIRAGDWGRIYVMADAFNVFNQSHENRRYDHHLGRYYPTTDRLSVNATDDLINEILNPLIVRFGVRFDF
jgi:hypothetical protein